MWMRMRTHAGLVCESDTFVAKDATSRLPRAEKLKTRPGDPVEQGRGKNKSASVSFIVRVDSMLGAGAGSGVPSQERGSKGEKEREREGGGGEMGFSK